MSSFNLPVPLGIYNFAQSCADVPGTIPQMKGKVLTCVPKQQAAPQQVGSLGVLNVFGGNSNTLLWVGLGVVVLIALSGKRGRR
jgi:hypothetical protein